MELEKSKRRGFIWYLLGVAITKLEMLKDL